MEFVVDQIATGNLYLQLTNTVVISYVFKITERIQEIYVLSVLFLFLFVFFFCCFSRSPVICRRLTLILSHQGEKCSFSDKFQKAQHGTKVREQDNNSCRVFAFWSFFHLFSLNTCLLLWLFSAHSRNQRSDPIKGIFPFYTGLTYMNHIFVLHAVWFAKLDILEKTSNWRMVSSSAYVWEGNFIFFNFLHNLLSLCLQHTHSNPLSSLFPSALIKAVFAFHIFHCHVTHQLSLSLCCLRKDSESPTCNSTFYCIRVD